jgi:hypothetical protein
VAGVTDTLERPLDAPDDAFWTDPWANRGRLYDRGGAAPTILIDGPRSAPAARATVPLAVYHSAPVRQAALRPFRLGAVLVGVRLDDGRVAAGRAFDPPQLDEPVVDPGPPPRQPFGPPPLDRSRHAIEDVLRVAHGDLVSNPTRIVVEREAAPARPVVERLAPRPPEGEGPAPAQLAGPGVSLAGPSATLLRAAPPGPAEAGQDEPDPPELVPSPLVLRGVVRAPAADALRLQREAGELLALPVALVLVSGGLRAAASVLELAVSVEREGDEVTGSFQVDLREARGTIDTSAPQTLHVFAVARGLWGGPHRLTLVAEADVGRAPPA